MFLKTIAVASLFAVIAAVEVITEVWHFVCFSTKTDLHSRTRSP